MFGVVIFRAPHVMIAIGLTVTFMGNAIASPNTLTVQGIAPADIKRSSSAKKRSAASPGAQGSQALPR
jgi:hypothetical protein